MAGKLGEGRLGRQIDLGFDEIGGFFFPVSNIVQPARVMRGNYGAPKEADAIEPDKPELVSRSFTRWALAVTITGRTIRELNGNRCWRQVARQRTATLKGAFYVSSFCPRDQLDDHCGVTDPYR